MPGGRRLCQSDTIECPPGILISGGSIMRHRRAELRWMGIGLVGLSFLTGSSLAWAQAGAETPAKMAQQLRTVVDRLNALAVRFDTDRNRSLSPDEQERMIKLVAEKYGPGWADRVKWLFKTADA